VSIDAAHDIIQDEYDRSYWLLDVEGDKGTTQVDRNMVVSCAIYVLFSNSSFLMQQRSIQPTPSKTNIFDHLMDDTPSSSVEDELQCHLATDVKEVRDGLMWWHERRTTFPRLSRMAHDYLSIPGKQLIFLCLSKVLNPLCCSHKCQCRTSIQPWSPCPSPCPQSPCGSIHAHISLHWTVEPPGLGAGWRY
jgi:hypothetical protein